MFDLDEMPLCCTALVACDFSHDRYSDQDYLDKIKVKMERDIKESWQKGFATIIVTLTTQQNKVKNVLVDMGFFCSEPMKKKRHPERDLYVLYLNLHDYHKDRQPIRARDASGRFIKANPFNK